MHVKTLSPLAPPGGWPWKGGWRPLKLSLDWAPGLKERRGDAHEDAAEGRAAAGARGELRGRRLLRLRGASPHVLCGAERRGDRLARPPREPTAGDGERTSVPGR